MRMLKEKQDSLAAIEAKIAELQKTYDESVAEKQKLERSIAQTAARLKRSSKLTTALADEQIRWDQSVKVSCTVKAAHVVTSIKQSPVFKGHIFLSSRRKLHMNWTTFKRSPIWKTTSFFVPKMTS